MASNTLNFTINLNGNAYKGVLQLNDSIANVVKNVEEASSVFKQLGTSSIFLNNISDAVDKATGAFRSLVGTSLEFEQQQANLKTLLNGDAEATKNLVAQIREYGKATVYDRSSLIEAQKTMMAFGIEGNPAHTGEVFTDNANYIRTLNRSDVNIGQKIVKFYRDNLRSKYETTSKTKYLHVAIKHVYCVQDGQIILIKKPD